MFSNLANKHINTVRSTDPAATLAAPPPPVTKPKRNNPLVNFFTIAGQITTTPWRNLEIAAQQMINTKKEERKKASVQQWALDKRTEYNWVSLAGSIVASAVTGSIQWNQTAAGHWVVLGAWYGGLLLSLFCIIISFHLSIVFATFGARIDGAYRMLDMVRVVKVENKQTVEKPGFGALWILQVPIMLLSYSIISYIVGLIVLVLVPLFRGLGGDDQNIAIAFIVYLTFGLGTYIAVCFMIYSRFLPQLDEPEPHGYAEPKLDNEFSSADSDHTKGKMTENVLSSRPVGKRVHELRNSLSSTHKSPLSPTEPFAGMMSSGSMV